MEIRIRETGAVVSETEFRALHPNTSMPQQLSAELLNNFGADIVFEGPQASGGEFWQYSIRDGVQELNGKWYTRYVLGPVFTDPAERAAYVAAKTAERNAGIQKSIVDATQQRLDDFAKTRGYDGILSACTYATSPTAKFAQEGQYCVIQRDATWTTLYAMLAEVEAGTRPMPTGFADVEPELPALEWPN